MSSIRVQELTPDIKPQPKYYLDDAAPTPAPTDFSRLKAHDMVPISVNVSQAELHTQWYYSKLHLQADLEDWVDDNSGGWEELDTSQTKQMIREKRREMRHQRQPPAKAPQPSIGAQRISDLQRIA